MDAVTICLTIGEHCVFQKTKDGTSQTIHNFGEEIGNLKAVINKLKQGLEEQKKVSEAARVTAEAQLEDQRKKLKVFT